MATAHSKSLISVHRSLRDGARRPLAETGLEELFQVAVGDPVARGVGLRAQTLREVPQVDRPAV